MSEEAPPLDTDRHVSKTGGPDIAALASLARDRLRAPPRGGTPTDPTWTTKRQVPLSAATLERLRTVSAAIGVGPLQAAALILEMALDIDRSGTGG